MTACSTVLNWPTAAVWIVGFVVGVSAMVVLALAAMSAAPTTNKP